jgi:hypothetical protein
MNACHQGDTFNWGTSKDVTAAVLFTQFVILPGGRTNYLIKIRYKKKKKDFETMKPPLLPGHIMRPLKKRDILIHQLQNMLYSYRSTSTPTEVGLLKMYCCYW